MEINIGDTFEYLTVLKQVPKPENRKTLGKYYLCQCKCGNQKIIDKKGLVSGGVKSCGCLKKQKVSESVTIDLTGNIYGRLTVLRKIPYEETPQHSEALWECKCECGNIITVRGTSLRKGSTKSCGCLHNELASIQHTKNEIGNKYGKLLVIDYAGSYNKNALWKCKCDCGNITNVLGINLRSGHTQSCGCMISTGEQKIQSLLQQNNIIYKTQYTNTDLLTNNGEFLKFDFAIFNNNNELQYMIEYHGRQHYIQSDFFDDISNIQYRDNLKREYCLQHNIPLIEISYLDYDTITIKDLLLGEEINDY